MVNGEEVKQNETETVSAQHNLEIINNLTVDDSWKERFKIIDEWYDCSGLFFPKENEKLKNISSKEARKISSSIYFKNGGLGSLIAAILFSPFYYLVKGLWLKAIVYTLIIMLIAMTIYAFFEKSLGSFGSIFFVLLAPFDYYRLKVLGKQW